MNLFRSEDHVSRWPGYDPASAQGVLPLPAWVQIFRAGDHAHQLDPDYLLHAQEVRQRLVSSLAAILKEAGKGGPFWGFPA